MRNFDDCEIGGGGPFCFDHCVKRTLHRILDELEATAAERQNATNQSTSDNFTPTNDSANNFTPTNNATNNFTPTNNSTNNFTPTNNSTNNFTPTHRRTRSDEPNIGIALHRSGVNRFTPTPATLHHQPGSVKYSKNVNKPPYVIKHVAGGPFPPENQNYANSSSSINDTIFKSIKETEALKAYISRRKYETSIELEKENAHFLLSEILLSAIEQMKWRNVISSRREYANFSYPSATVAATAAPPPDDPTIDNNTVCCGSPGTIPPSSFTVVMKSSYQQNLHNSNFAFHDSPVITSSAEEFDEEYLRASSSSSSRDRSSFASRSIDDVIFGGDATTGLVESGGKSAAGTATISEEFSSSAEKIATDLLEKFSKNHFSTVYHTPNVQQRCMVSYKDAPQRLLPVPSSITIAPDEVYVEGSDAQVRLRGTFEWAPPRPQIIFNLHKPQRLKDLLINQCNRCPGCGRYIESSYYKRLRYCTYLGKAFCQCCHRGETCLVPAYILHKWNFRKYPVSDFSRQFLTSNRDQPFFNVCALNPNLYAQVKALRRAYQLRRRCSFAYDYLKICHLAKKILTKDGGLLNLYDKLPAHFLRDPNLYSVRDFVEISDGSYVKRLEHLFEYAKIHIEACSFCADHGFYCEFCEKKQILFPFQFEAVRRCDYCGSCYHKKCMEKNKNQCRKCRRIEMRRAVIFESDEDQ